MLPFKCIIAECPIVHIPYVQVVKTNEKHGHPTNAASPQISGQNNIESPSKVRIATSEPGISKQNRLFQENREKKRDSRFCGRYIVLNRRLFFQGDVSTLDGFDLSPFVSAMPQNLLGNPFQEVES